MKKIFLTFCLSGLLLSLRAQETMQLTTPSEKRGTTVMEAFANRQFVREYQTRDLSDQDLSDLLWAAWGINRENGKRTAPTAQNSQDIDVYVCRESGTYLYDASAHSLILVTTDDIRPLLEGRRPTGAPVCLLIVSDMSRYNGYTPGGEENEHYYEMGAVDAGIVSQNISLFCAGNGLGTGPRASMDQSGIRTALNLTESQRAWLNHPVGYPAE